MPRRRSSRRGRPRRRRTFPAVRHAEPAGDDGGRDDVAGGVETGPGQRHGRRAAAAARRRATEQTSRARGCAAVDGSRARAGEPLRDHPARPRPGPRAHVHGGSPTTAVTRGGAGDCARDVAGVGTAGEDHRGTRRGKRQRLRRRSLRERPSVPRYSRRGVHEPVHRKWTRPARRRDAQAQGANHGSRGGCSLRPRAVVRGQRALRVGGYHGHQREHLHHVNLRGDGPHTAVPGRGAEQGDQRRAVQTGRRRPHRRQRRRRRRRDLLLHVSDPRARPRQGFIRARVRYARQRVLLHRG